MADLPQRIAKHIAISTECFFEGTPCWEYVGPRLSSNGYGRVHWKGKERAFHRVIYEIKIGPIPEGKILDHRCRNRPCCNPKHTEPVTHRENTLRGKAVLFCSGSR